MAGGGGVGTASGPAADCETQAIHLDYHALSFNSIKAETKNVRRDLRPTVYLEIPLFTQAIQNDISKLRDMRRVFHQLAQCNFRGRTHSNNARDVQGSSPQVVFLLAPQYHGLGERSVPGVQTAHS